MALQGRSWESNIRLSLAGAPVTGALRAAVTVRFRRPGGTTLETKTVVAGDWLEIGNGLYVLKWFPSEMAAVGPFYFEVVGGAFDPHIDEFDIMPNTPSQILTPGTCVVSGNIVDLGAQASTGHPIRFRLAKAPAVAAGAFVAGAILETRPDAYGAFSIALNRGSKVVVDIEAVALRHQITIPDQETANLVDLLPPIP